MSHSRMNGSELTAAYTTCALRYDRGMDNNRQGRYGAGAHRKGAFWGIIIFRLILLNKA